MLFYVHGQDRPGVQAEMEVLAEAHWSYMDRFADRLILRGPMLSGDGAEHTGSVHVVDLADRVSAERFATEEPYWQAGLYWDITVARAVVLHHCEPAEELFAASALVTGQWPARPCDLPLSGADPDGQVSFVALLVDDDQSCTTGIVAVAEALPGEAAGIVQPLADRLGGEPVALTAQRWTRGGRPAELPGGQFREVRCEPGNRDRGLLPRDHVPDRDRARLLLGVAVDHRPPGPGIVGPLELAAELARVTEVDAGPQAGLPGGRGEAESACGVPIVHDRHRYVEPCVPGLRPRQHQQDPLQAERASGGG